VTAHNGDDEHADEDCYAARQPSQGADEQVETAADENHERDPRGRMTGDDRARRLANRWCPAIVRMD
jgi:hypothetical protein